MKTSLLTSDQLAYEAGTTRVKVAYWVSTGVLVPIVPASRRGVSAKFDRSDGLVRIQWATQMMANRFSAREIAQCFASAGRQVPITRMLISVGSCGATNREWKHTFTDDAGLFDWREIDELGLVVKATQYGLAMKPETKQTGNGASMSEIIMCDAKPCESMVPRAEQPTGWLVLTRVGEPGAWHFCSVAHAIIGLAPHQPAGQHLITLNSGAWDRAMPHVPSSDVSREA